MIFFRNCFSSVICFCFFSLLLSNSYAVEGDDPVLERFRQISPRLGMVDSHFNDNPVGEDRLVVLGRAGDGKSSLINYCAGVPLKWDVPRDSRRRVKRVVLSDDERGLRIGHTHSMTRLDANETPGKLDIDGYGEVFDTPGFHGVGIDSMQEIVDMYYINGLLRKPRCVKLLLTFPYPSLEQRGRSFIDHFRAMKDFLPDQLLNNSVLVMTKVPHDCKEDCLAALHDIADMDEDTGVLLNQFFAGNKVTMFLRPEMHTDVLDDVEGREEILATVRQAPFSDVTADDVINRDVVLRTEVADELITEAENKLSRLITEYEEQENTTLEQLVATDYTTEEQMLTRRADFEAFIARIRGYNIDLFVQQMEDDALLDSVRKLLPLRLQTTIEGVTPQLHLSSERVIGRVTESLNSLLRDIDNTRTEREERQYGVDYWVMDKQKWNNWHERYSMWGWKKRALHTYERRVIHDPQAAANPIRIFVDWHRVGGVRIQNIQHADCERHSPKHYQPRNADGLIERGHVSD